jgi:hypothetical protein
MEQVSATAMSCHSCCVLLKLHTAQSWFIKSILCYWLEAVDAHSCLSYHRPLWCKLHYSCTHFASEVAALLTGSEIPVGEES